MHSNWRSAEKNKHRYTFLSTINIVTLFLGVPAYAQTLATDALPSGGTVASGNAILDYSQLNELHVNQNTDRTVINWGRFDIGANAIVQFHQPSTSSLAVNRITGEGDPSRILGQLKANGKIMVLDRNGVFFGEGARIDIGSIIVSTGDVRDKDAMENRVVSIDGIKSNGVIVNNGNITVHNAGLAAFVAPTVINAGVIEAKIGRIDIGAGSLATVDLYGDGLVELALPKPMSQTLTNSGILNAEGGIVRIQAAAAADMVDNVINNTGIIAADTIGVNKGKIILGSQVATKTKVVRGTDITINNGHLRAAGYQDEEAGGSIDILGDAVFLGSASRVDTSGQSGGGNIRVGGDYLGTGDTPKSRYTYVDKDSVILNNAIASGNGGRTIIWSDDTTDFYGSVYGRGGQSGGDGGFVETSGKKNLLAKGYVDLTAFHGNKGTYLLDPADITIYGDFDPRFQSTDNSINLADSLLLWLDAGDLATLSKDTDADGIGDTPAGNNDFIALWQDKSGNGHHSYQGNAGIQPTLILNARNGLPMVMFNNSDRMEFTPFTGHQSAFFTYDDAANNSWTTPLGSAYASYGSYHGAMDANGLFSSIYTDPNTLNGANFVNGVNIGDGTSTRRPISTSVHSYIAAGNLTQNVQLLGSDQCCFPRTIEGGIAEMLLYDTQLTPTERILLEQYNAAKWDIALDPLSGAGAEAAEAMDAAGGYGAFTTRYLERLSDTADIVLQAVNSITLDFIGDTLNLANDRSITLTTTGGDIKTASLGSIVTNRTGNGGNITFNAGNDIAFDHAFILDAQNGGQIQLNAANGVSAPAGLTVAHGNLGVDAQSITGIYDGQGAVLDSNNGTIATEVNFNSLDIKGAGASMTAGYIGSPGPATQTMANLITLDGIAGAGNPQYTFAGFNIGHIAPPPPPPLPETGNPGVSESIASFSTQISNIAATSYAQQGETVEELLEYGLIEADGKTPSRSGNCISVLVGAGCVVQ